MTDEFDITLFKTIFDQSPVSTQVFTTDGETCLVNKAWEKLWNVSYTQVKGYNVLKDKQLVETGTMPFIQRGFNGDIVELPPIKYVPSKTLDIPTAVAFRWVAAKMYPIKNKKNKIIYLVLQHEDITERRHAEVITSRLAAIVESSDDAIVSKNLDGVITSWNKSAEHMFGYKASEAVGKHIFLIIPPALRDEEALIISRIKQGKRVRHFRTVRKTKSSEDIHVSLTISPVKDGTGKIIGASKIARDITKEIKSADSLRESEERLRIALDAGEIGVWDWNIIDNSLMWTDNVFSIHGVTKKTFSPSFEKFRMLIHHDDKERVSQALQDSLRSHTEFTAEFRIVTPNGEVRWVSTKALPTYDKENNAVRVLGATSDITKQKQLDQEKK